MKKALIIFSSVLGAALLCAGVWFFLTTARQNAAAEAAHDAVLQEYAQLEQSAADTALTVTENGSEIGRYSLEALGVQRGTENAVAAAFSATDLMDAEAFSELPFRNKQNWDALPHPRGIRIPVDMDGFDASPVMTALDSVPREPAQDAYAYFDGTGFSIQDAVPGTMLKKDVIEEALYEAVSQMSVDSSGPQTRTLEITDYDCYLSPEVTRENTEFDFAPLLQERVSAMRIQVRFRDELIALDGSTLRHFVKLDRDGRVQVQKKTLDQQLSAWSELYAQKDTEYIFNSFVDGPVPVSFLHVNYELDQDALRGQLIPLLETLESGSAEASFLCTTLDGEPFSIENSYIEVDLTNQHMAYYQDGALVVDTDIVSGTMKTHDTPTGLYESFYKAEDCWLSGEDYYVFVDYWISVTRDGVIGLHDADWRTRFGGEMYTYWGSHGCVNTPKEAMKTIYDTINVDDHIPILIYKHPKPESSGT